MSIQLASLRIELEDRRGSFIVLLLLGRNINEEGDAGHLLTLLFHVRQEGNGGRQGTLRLVLELAAGQLQGSHQVLVLGPGSLRVEVVDLFDELERGLVDTTDRRVKREPPVVVLDHDGLGVLVEEHLDRGVGTAVGDGVVKRKALHVVLHANRLFVLEVNGVHHVLAGAIHAGHVKDGAMVGSLSGTHGLAVGAKQVINDLLRRVHGNGVVQRERLGLFERVVKDIAVGDLAGFAGMRLDALLDAGPGLALDELVQSGRCKHGDVVCG